MRFVATSHDWFSTNQTSQFVTEVEQLHLYSHRRGHNDEVGLPSIIFMSIKNTQDFFDQFTTDNSITDD